MLVVEKIHVGYRNMEWIEIGESAFADDMLTMWGIYKKKKNRDMEDVYRKEKSKNEYRQDRSNGSRKIGFEYFNWTRLGKNRRNKIAFKYLSVWINRDSKPEGSFFKFCST